MADHAGPRADGRLTLHVAGPHDLPRLGREMANCLASYGRGRTQAGERIVEVRRDGRTAYAVHVRAGRVVTFEAAGNRPPPPEDVPVVHDLLQRAGLLEATRQAAASARRPAPRGARRRPAAPIRRQRPAPRVQAPPGVSVQQLAAQLLAGGGLGGVEWPELAVALWATGSLPRPPDPDEVAWEQVVRDLAERVALGADAELPTRPPPSPEERDEVRRGLLANSSPRTIAGQQRRRMAEVLAEPIRP